MENHTIVTLKKAKVVRLRLAVYGFLIMKLRRSKVDLQMAISYVCMILTVIQWDVDILIKIPRFVSV